MDFFDYFTDIKLSIFLTNGKEIYHTHGFRLVFCECRAATKLFIYREAFNYWGAKRQRCGGKLQLRSSKVRSSQRHAHETSPHSLSRRHCHPGRFAVIQRLFKNGHI